MINHRLSSTIAVTFHFAKPTMRLFVDNLSNVDFSFLHPTRGLVGETWLASVELEGDLDHQGMVCDFGVVKRMLREWLDEKIDHTLLVPTRSPALKQFAASGDSLRGANTSLNWHTRSAPISMTSPSEAVTLIDCEAITAASVAAWCIDQLKPQFPDSVRTLTLRFTPEHIEGPYYHYSHGLKKHKGNCQRIAHGHRSKILIWRNGELSFTDMKHWAEQWQDIYIGTKADVVAEHPSGHYEFHYHAPQGEFLLQVPKAQCYLINTDSTIEFIAQHIASVLKSEHPHDDFTVKAFEGLAKGAIAEA